MKVSAMIADKWLNHNVDGRLTDENIAYLTCYAGDDHVEDDNEGAEQVDRMGHSGILKAIETALTCDEQKRGPTAKDKLLSRRWCGLCRKEMEGESHTPIRQFSQKYIHLHKVTLC
jgi:hypothetical protein